ncbi:MAG: hypothetical protein AABX50_02235 [Nanoarchaeota archaeon]
MERRIVLWVAIGVLFLAVLFLTYRVSNLTGNTAAGSSGKLDTTGWTENEIMNYEMHGTIPARVTNSGTSTSNSGGMVGGC